jgi:hypothetical protein
MCKSDQNFDYHGIIFLKEIPWTKSTGLWTDEKGTGPWVHGGPVSIRLQDSNLERPFWIRQLARRRPGQRRLWAARLATRRRGLWRPTRIGLRWPGDHRGLAGSKRENWGTRFEPHRRVGGGEAAGR